MKKNIFYIFAILIMLLTASNVNAAGKYLHDSVGNNGSTSEFDIVVYNYFINQSDETVKFRWERINVNVPENWETSVCVGDVCYLPDISTEIFYLNPGDTMEVLAHFYPYNHEGIGSHVVKIYPDTAGSSNAESAVFYGFISAPTSTFENKSNKIKITRLYPNPVSDNLSLQLSHYSNYQITVFNVLGEKVMDISVSNSNSANISMSNLNNGMYMISVTDIKSGSKVTRTISKF